MTNKDWSWQLPEILTDTEIEGGDETSLDIASEVAEAPLYRLVRVVKVEGETALVEWTDAVEGLVRRFVPHSDVVAGAVQDEILNKGIEYGIDWSALASEFQFTPARLQNELRRAGIWTAEDAQANPKTIFAALQRAIGLDVSTIQRFAHRQLRDGGQK